MKRESFRKGMKDGVPIALGYFAVSFTFGMMAVAGGLRIWQAVLISLTNLTSAGQFAGLDIIFAGGSMWEMAMTQLIINLRYCLMSFSLSQKFRREESGILKYIAAFGITDEISGSVRPRRERSAYFIITEPCAWQFPDGLLELWQEESPEAFCRILCLVR